MSKTFDQGLQEIAAICKYFATNHEAFLAPGVKEAHVRQSLIDPFFEALGWNVRNNPPVAPHLREVIPEDSLEVEGAQRAPDYTFRVGTTPRFFVEAKKCGVNLQSDPASAYQLRRYGWSAKVALSVLTDFEELGVYDCTMRPRPTDKASHARIQYFRFDEYVDRWRELWDVFSREAMWSGAFDQYAASKRKRGTSEVDVEFLKEIEGWRESLARNIALRNTAISSDDLNAAVQVTIDRVVFLRMAEDRGLESYEQLLNLCERPDIYARFMRDVCRRADEKYNSGLFHFDKEAGVSETPDRITPKLSVDDKVFKPIIQSLYFAHGSPYDFRVMPVEILGTVYERFLGKVIRLTAGHQAKIEAKPEVRKAGGVYYTPACIVDYIVKQAVGRQIEDKAPAQLAGGKGKPPFRILDMACGSGSFLLGAYQCLLDHCLSWYIDREPEIHRKAVYQDPHNGAWRLTIEEKKRILTAHLFGVDIDPQAVEVTKLSLLLKALEGENDATFSLQLKLFHDRALPNLADNIKCGNSLIGRDSCEGRQMTLLDREEVYRINAFDWRKEFPQVFAHDGFDVVIGNPPYIRIQAMKEWAPVEVEFYKQRYRAASQGNYDIYVVFVERGLDLLNSTGWLGFILPHKFFNAEYGKPLRTLLTEGRHLAQIVHFGSQQVFATATTYTCLLFLSKAPSRRCRFVQVEDLDDWIKTGQGQRGELLAEEINGIAWNIQIGPDAKVMRRLAKAPLKLKDVAHLFVGLQTDADDVFILEEVKRQGGRVLCASRATGKNHWFEADHLKPFLKGSLDVRRYGFSGAAKHLIFPYRNTAKASLLIPAEEYAEAYPLTWAYLLENRPRLARRAKGKLGPAWYGYVYKKNHLRFEQPKILAPAIAPGACFAWDEAGSCYFVGSGGGGGGGYGIVLPPESPWSPLYLLGLLNSALTTYWLKRTSSVFRGGYLALNRQYIEEIPLIPAQLASPSDRSRHDRLVKLVEQMLALHGQSAARTAQKQVALSRQIAATDVDIDRLVYELYGLTDDEIRIVEESTAAVAK